jgi:hypothetical protein
MNYLYNLMRWGELDFRSLDKTIKAQLLMIYTSMAAYPYDKKGDMDVFKKLQNSALRNLTFKVCHMFGSVWKLMFGCMPSGAYETSHGDSWIVVFLYFLFIVHQMNKFPERYSEIEFYLSKRLICLVVYGDDSIYGVPASVEDVIGINLFSDFVRDYFDMETRDLLVFDSMLSVPNTSTGRFKVRRTCFLQNYFVRREEVTDRTDVSSILPYRDFWKILTKMPFGSGEARVYQDYVMASIGMAYDTRGTNLVAWEFCRYIFEWALSKCGSYSFDELYAQWNPGVDITSRMAKVGIPLSSLKHGFPSMMKLMDKHVYDAEVHDSVSGSSELLFDFMSF